MTNFDSVRLLAASALIAGVSFATHSFASPSETQTPEPTQCETREVSVYFAPSQTSLNDLAKELIQRTTERLDGCDLARVEVHGFADASGPAEQNQSLSEARTEAVLSFLSEEGMEIPDVFVAAYGEDGATRSDGTPVIMRRKADIRLIPVGQTA